MDVPYRPRSVSVRARLKSCESRLAAGTNASSAAGVATKPRAHSLDLLALAEEGGAPSKVERSTQSLDYRTLRGVGGATSEVGRVTQSFGGIGGIQPEQYHSGSHGSDSSFGGVPTEASNAGTVLSNPNASDSSFEAVPTETSNAGTVFSNANANEDMAVTGSGAEVGRSNAQTSHVDLDSSQKQRLFKILSQEPQDDTEDRCTQFKAAVCKLGKELVVKKEGDALLQYAASLGYERVIHLLCSWRVDVNKKSCLTKSTPLLNVVSRNHLREQLTERTVKALIQCGAKHSVNAENNVGDTALFMAIRRRLSGVFSLLLNAGADPAKLDEGGNTILHAAAEVNAVEICGKILAREGINKWEIIAAMNDDEQTAIHLAAMHEQGCLEKIITALGLDYSSMVEWFSAEDSKGRTPLDIAAKAGQQDTFKYMWEEMEHYSAAHIDVEHMKLKMLIEEAERDPSQWQKVTDAIRGFPKRMLHKLLVEDAHGKKPSFQQLITASKSGTPVNMEHGQQEAVRAVLDKSLFGDRVIVTETLDGSKHTAQFKLEGPCESRSTNRSKGSNLTALCKSDFQVWDHQTVTLWLNQKLKTCGGIGLLLYCFLYWAFLGVASIALEAAANLNVTSEQLLDYSNAKNSQRQTLEIAAATMWFLLFILDLFDVIRFRLYYLKWFGVYPRIAVNLLFLALLVTRFCGHNSQWVLASLFVICAAVRAMEVFTVWKWSSVYLITLWIILRRELLKFLLIALLLVLTFSVAMRFAMQAERDQASKLQNSIPNNQSGLCDPVTSVLENGTNTSCTSTTPLTELLASKLLGSLESLHNIFYANFDSLVRGPRVLQDGAGLGGYKIFTAVIYFAFLGLVVLLLVSVFIAQANGCYNNVKDIADQMANYSCARLLTQTSTMLPEWLFNAITKKCTRNTSSYVWSDWPCHRSCTCCTNTSFLRSIWQIIPSVLVTKASSLVKSKEEQRSIDDLKSDFDVTVKVMQEENQKNFNALKDAVRLGNERSFDALKSEMDELKHALRSIQRHLAGQHANQ